MRLCGGASSGPFPRRQSPEAIWRSAESWLNNIVTTDPSTLALIQQCRDCLARLPSGRRISFFQSAILRTDAIVEMLGPTWLDDEVINSSTEYVMQGACIGLARRTHVANCFFPEIIRSARAAAGGQSAPTRPHAVDSAIRSGAYDCLMIPLHITNHWTRITVDLVNHTIQFMDPRDDESSQLCPPTRAIEDLQWWLKSVYPDVDFRVLESVPRPNAESQRDGHSCGIVVASEIASDLLGELRWTQETWREHRMRWFLRFARIYFDDETVSFYYWWECD